MIIKVKIKNTIICMVNSLSVIFLDAVAVPSKLGYDGATAKYGAVNLIQRFYG